MADPRHAPPRGTGRKAGVTALACAGLAFGMIGLAFASVPLYAFATWMRVRHEERLLRSQFGAAYDAYAARVKRFVPGLF